jgi:flagellar biogenesis protein FliO
MEILPLMRMLGVLALLLAALWGALWVVRRYDVKLPGRVGGPPVRRLQLVDRLPVDARRSLLLVRRDDVEHLILIGPDHALLLENVGAAAPAPVPGIGDRADA